jgi:hypothetical protein
MARKFTFCDLYVFAQSGYFKTQANKGRHPRLGVSRTVHAALKGIVRRQLTGV